MRAKFYIVENPEILSNLKVRLKAKRGYPTEQGQGWLEFIQSVNYNQEVFLTDEEVKHLNNMGIKLITVTSECDCGYCPDCITNKINQLSDEDRQIIRQMDELMDSLSDDGKQLYNSRYVAIA